MASPVSGSSGGLQLRGGEGSDEAVKQPASQPQHHDAHREHQDAKPFASDRNRRRATAILRKILFLHPDQKNPVRTVLEDVVIGTIVGVLLVMFLWFVDLRGVIRLRSARNMMLYVHDVLSDPENLQSLEEDLGIKFMPTHIYDDIKYEMDYHQKEIDDMIKWGLSMYEREEAEYAEIIDDVRKEHAEVTAQLEKDWCGSCSGGWGNCNARVNFLKEKYGRPEVKAKMDIMSKGKCLKNG